jgi:hypothetical protein
MEQNQAIANKINDFIYQQPEVVVVILQQFGYDININTATLSQITSLVYSAIYYQDTPFIEALENAMANDGQNNVLPLIPIGLSVLGSVASYFGGAEEGRKNRDLQKSIALAQMSMQEKLAEEQLRVEQETARMGILVNSLLEYRKTLQKESTARLKDTWLYVTGLGIGLGILYGVYLIGTPSKN